MADYKKKKSTGARKAANISSILIVVLLSADFIFESLRVVVSNRSMEVDGFGKFLAYNLTLVASNGHLEVGNFYAGSLTLTTSNGRLSASDIGLLGNLTMRTSNGGVRVDNAIVGGETIARTSNGSITFANVEMDEDNANFSTSNGSVTINGRRWQQRR